MTYPSASNANGIWTLRDLFLARKADSWPSDADPYFSNVSLLLPMDGANGSTTFTDESNNSFTVTANGNAQISTTQSKFGGASAAFDGTGDYLSIANNAAFQFGTGDFTVEGWFYAGSQDKSYMTLFSIGSYTEGILLRRQTTADNLYIANTSYSYDQSYLPIGEWVHVAITRSSGLVDLWLNGNARVSATNTSNLAQTNNLFIGTSAHSLSDSWNGYIDDFRITKGVARYAGFTPPTSSLTAITDTVLLLNMDGTNGSTTFTDSSSSSHTVTANGDAQISTAQSKFGGASAAFDGTGDYLQITHSAALAFASDDFTIETWIYPNTATTNQLIFNGRDSVSAFQGVNIYLTTTRQIALVITTSGFSWQINTLSGSGTVLSLSDWSHVAVTRSGSLFSVWVNGVISYTATLSGSIVSANSYAFIGGIPGMSSFVDGYIDDFRIIKGVALYPESFTPPTRPHPVQ